MTLRTQRLYPMFVILLALSVSGCGPTLLIGGATAAKVAHDRRTAAAQLEDQVIEVKMLAALQQAGPELGRTHVNVTSYNKVVLLSGEIERPEVKQWLETAASAIDGVRFVHNELKVTPPSAWISRSNDVWLTTKAKTSAVVIRDIPGFDPTRVKVVTERGVVYLFGLVTQQEGDAITEKVRRLQGVQQVVKLFEYIETT